MPSHDYTPVFRFRPIGRLWVKTLEEVRAADPWNGDRVCTFWVEDYRLVAAAGCSLPAIVSELDRITRFMPESLCDPYRHGDIPAALLPGLLKDAETDLIYADFLPVLRNPVFSASYFAFVVVSVIALLITLFVLFEEDVSTWFGELVLFGLFAVWWPWWHFGYRRKLQRRRQQRANFLAAARAVAHPPAMNAAKLLSLDEIAERLSQTAVRAGIPVQELPSYGRTRDFGYPHIEVDDAYHYVVVERGQERSRCSTTDFADLEFWVFEPIFGRICSRRAAAARVAGVDYRRAWFADQAEQMGRINPGWRRRWEGQVQVILQRAPFLDQ